MQTTIFKILTITTTALVLSLTAVDTTSPGEIANEVMEATTNMAEQDSAKSAAPDATKEIAAAKEPVKAAPTITEVDMAYVESKLADAKSGKVYIVSAIKADTIEGSITVLADADDKIILDSLKDKNSEIITYCWNKDCTAGATLANRLVALGYTNVKHYKGGIVEWKENKKPFTENK